MKKLKFFSVNEKMRQFRETGCRSQVANSIKNGELLNSYSASILSDEKLSKNILMMIAKIPKIQFMQLIRILCTWE